MQYTVDTRKKNFSKEIIIKLKYLQNNKEATNAQNQIIMKNIERNLEEIKTYLIKWFALVDINFE